MKPQKRLEAIEEALVVYQKRVKKDDKRFYTCIYPKGRYYGFCNFFGEQGIILADLTELWELQPSKIEFPGFWWDRRNKRIRIKALKKAIKTVKLLIKWQNN